VVAQYETGAGLFMDFIAERDIDVIDVSAHDVSTFVTRYCARPVKLAPPELTSILPSFLRFLQVDGATALPLAQAVPTVASWSDSSLPKALPQGHATRLLRSCDRRTAHGRRDYAILVLLVRLGLRAGEVVIHGKGRREDRLPLPVDVGEAVVSYLRRGRPRADCRTLFLRTAAPLVGMTPKAVNYVVYSACDVELGFEQRTGHGKPHPGTRRAERCGLLRPVVVTRCRSCGVGRHGHGFVRRAG
jgi:integrase/recombinase XerD